MGLLPQEQSRVLVAFDPALGQIGQIRQGSGQAGLVQHGKTAVAGPEDQDRTTVRTVEGSTSISSRLVKLLLVWLHVLEGMRRRYLFVIDRKHAERRRGTVGPPPFGESDTPIEHFARLEFL